MTIHATKRGDKVTLPEKEFKKLLAMAEELADIKAFDRAMKKIKSGKAELVPWGEVKIHVPQAVKN